MSAASLSQGCVLGGAAWRSAGAARCRRARHRVYPDGTDSQHGARRTPLGVDGEPLGGTTATPPPDGGGAEGGGTRQDSCKLTPSPTLPRARGRGRTEYGERE